MTSLLSLIRSWLRHRRREHHLLATFRRDHVTERELHNPTYYDSW